MDTNVWLERLLDQERSEEVGHFLVRISAQGLCLTDFSFHSIAIVMSRLRRLDGLRRFVQDTLVDGGVTLVRMGAESLEDILDAHERFALDFDDAYQYVAAIRHSLVLVSFDADFDRTDRGRKTPREIAHAPQQGGT